MIFLPKMCNNKCDELLEKLIEECSTRYSDCRLQKCQGHEIKETLRNFCDEGD